MQKVDHGKEISISAEGVLLPGMLKIPHAATGLVIFSHGSGSSRFSPRNMLVAGKLNRKDMATLLIDLLTPEEDSIYENRFDIDLLTARLIAVTECMNRYPETSHLRIGYFGASTGAASALSAAGELHKIVHAVVCRGGRPDLAVVNPLLIKMPVLFIVGSQDEEVIELNQHVYGDLLCEMQMIIVDGASHLFEEPGKLEEVARLASDWFGRYLKK